MNITAHKRQNTCTLLISGRIDTLTAPELEKAFSENADSCEKMIFDMSGADYISSAGLRVLVSSHRNMEKKNGLVLKGVKGNVSDILKMTGFDGFLNIEK